MKRSEKQKNLMRSAIAPTIVATIIFFITYFFFGMENTMIGPFATLSFLRYRNMCNHYECLIRNFIVYMIMAVFSFLAVINLPLCILINAAALFWLAYLLIDEYNPNNYFPAGMALIFFQIAPVHTFSALGHRLLALLASFAIVFLFSWLLSRKENTQKRLIGLIQEGFEVCRQLLDLTAKDGDASSFAENVNELLPVHKKLCEINQKCSMEIYSSNRAALRHKGKINWYCRFVLVFQVINYLTNHPEQEGNLARAEEIYAKFYPQFLTTEPTADYRKLTFRVRKPDIRNMRLRFALRQVIILTPCLVISYLWQSNNIRLFHDDSIYGTHRTESSAAYIWHHGRHFTVLCIFHTVSGFCFQSCHYDSGKLYDLCRRRLRSDGCLYHLLGTGTSVHRQQRSDRPAAASGLYSYRCGNCFACQ